MIIFAISMVVAIVVPFLLTIVLAKTKMGVNAYQRLGK